MCIIGINFLANDAIVIVKHKLEWIDKMIEEWRRIYDCVPNFIFITHSIGAHFTQSLLLRRPDILAKTLHIIHLTPFIRFDPPPMKKRVLSSVAKSHKYIIPIMTNLVRALSSSGLPRSWIDLYLKHVAGLDCTNGREIAIDVFMNPNMVKNHLLLGCQELNELTEYPNDVAFRLIGGITSTSILFCGNDHWAPEFHFADINDMQRNLTIPDNIHAEYKEELSHDFIVHLGQVGKVVSFCVTRIRNCTKHKRSRL
jgi:pimeloyl-ACP methyl ester carboxylesterase